MDNITHIHPAPSIPNPFATNPWSTLSDQDIEDGVRAAEARIDAAEHTRKSLIRERQRRVADQNGEHA